ncbi:TLC domain-containing protein 4-B-like [Convolutriloba macropyga]|uniref:TLC domain-containing protein 4-B-like n=1 Tax=Convolutriloba macropyga TaxID=536237 RepID=UPI003F524631
MTDWNKNSPQYNYRSAAVEVLLFTILWRFFTRVGGPKISVFFYKKYLDFDASTRLVWNTYVVSTVHSVAVSVLALWMLYYYPEIRTGDGNGRQDPGPKAYQLTMAFSCGYFLSDIYVLLRYDYLFGKKVEIVHHLVSAVGTFYVAVTSYIPFWGCLQLLHEFSTPIVNLRWFLLTCGIGKERRRYTVVCMVMLLVFFLCRILPIPYFWSTLIPVCFLSSPKEQLCNTFFVKAFALCFLGMDILNLHWFRLMILVLFRAVKENLIKVKSKLKLHFRFQEDDEEEVFYDAHELDVSSFSPI